MAASMPGDLEFGICGLDVTVPQDGKHEALSPKVK